MVLIVFKNTKVCSICRKKRKNIYQILFNEKKIIKLKSKHFIKRFTLLHHYKNLLNVLNS
jgi:hypothetical protein